MAPYLVFHTQTAAACGGGRPYIRLKSTGMRLISFELPTAPSPRIGAHILPDNVVIDFTSSLPGCPPTMKGFLEGGEAMLATAAAVIASPDAVRYPFGDVVLKVLFNLIGVIQVLPHCSHTIEVLARISADSKRVAKRAPEGGPVLILAFHLEASISHVSEK